MLLGIVSLAPRQVAVAGTAEAGRRYTPPPGSHSVAVYYDDWYDASRQRPLPVKIYHPRESAGPFPVVIFSHGLGGSRESSAFLGDHWAAHGYVVVYVQHPGSDTEVWSRGLVPGPGLKSAVNPENSAHRVLDVKFALHELSRLNREDELWQGRLDLNRVGVAGHSYGAFTSLALAGQIFRGRDGREISLADSRIKAAVALSPPAPPDRAWRERAYQGVHIPVLHLTGTRDKSVVTSTRPEERREPYNHIDGADQYLLILQGGDHMVFSGRRWLPWGRKGDKRFHRIIRVSTQAFWDAYLKGDAAAKKWLATGGLDEAMGEDGTLEVKLR